MDTFKYQREFIAGFTSAVISSALLHPIDTIKVNQIHNRTPLVQTIRNLYNVGNLKIFYKALPVNVSAYSLTYAIYFPLNRYIFFEKNMVQNLMAYIFLSIDT